LAVRDYRGAATGIILPAPAPGTPRPEDLVPNELTVGLSAERLLVNAPPIVVTP
jgi:hypothetical protein